MAKRRRSKPDKVEMARRRCRCGRHPGRTCVSCRSARAKPHGVLCGACQKVDYLRAVKCEHYRCRTVISARFRFCFKHAAKDGNGTVIPELNTTQPRVIPSDLPDNFWTCRWCGHDNGRPGERAKSITRCEWCQKGRKSGRDLPGHIEPRLNKPALYYRDPLKEESRAKHRPQSLTAVLHWPGR